MIMNNESDSNLDITPTNIEKQVNKLCISQNYFLQVSKDKNNLIQGNSKKI